MKTETKNHIESTGYKQVMVGIGYFSLLCEAGLGISFKGYPSTKPQHRFFLKNEKKT